MHPEGYVGMDLEEWTLRGDALLRQILSEIAQGICFASEGCEEGIEV